MHTLLDSENADCEDDDDDCEMENGVLSDAEEHTDGQTRRVMNTPETLPARSTDATPTDGQTTRTVSTSTFLYFLDVALRIENFHLLFSSSYI